MSPFTWVGIVLTLAAMAALVVYREKVRSGAGSAATFLTEVKGEVLKITWPTRDDLRKATMVILGFVIVVAIIIGAMDIILQWLLVRLPSRIS